MPDLDNRSAIARGSVHWHIASGHQRIAVYRPSFWSVDSSVACRTPSITAYSAAT